MRAFLRAMFAVLATAIALPAAASATIPALPSQWYGLPGLNAASGAQWVRAYAYGTPPNVVYAGLEGGGVYRSVTGGASWSAFNAGFDNPLTTNVRALSASSTGTTVWAGTDSGLWKSEGGGPWKPIAQGPEDDPAQPKKLNQSVQAVLSIPLGPMLAGVFSGGVYRSTDGGATWQPPAVNNGMPASATIWSLTSNIPGVVYATGSDGVFVSVNGGTTWTRFSDGIPDSATPMATWAHSITHPNIMYASTASNGIYRSVTGGVTWSPINRNLGAVRARGFQVFGSGVGAHLYAATENGLWETFQSGTIAPTDDPKWRKITAPGLGFNEIMWALTAPEIPGNGALGLMVGTQSNGGYFLQFQPVDSPCSVNAPDATTNCPRLDDLTPHAGQQLTALNGKWTGTPTIDYDYQWQICSTSNSSSCADIPDAQDTTYVLPAATAQGKYYRVKISASNPAPGIPSNNKRYSLMTNAATAAPGTEPGANQISGVNITVQAPGSNSGPTVGDTLVANDGQSNPNPAFSDGIFNPKATQRKYQWSRCFDAAGNNCDDIKGALGTGTTYKVVTADSTRYMKVVVTGTNSAGAATATDVETYAIISLPAAIAPAIKDPDHPGQFKSQAPSVSGTPYVGETLVGSVGGWQDPTTDYLRRWLRCDTDGTSCSTIYKPATVDIADDPTYQLQPADKGYVIRLRVTADVNNDLTPDGTDNHLPHATEYDTAPTAVITDKPIPAPPGGGGSGGDAGGAGGSGGGNTPQSDTAAPVLAGLTISKTKFVAGKGTVFNLQTSEAGKVRVVITKATSGRKVKGACVAITKKNRKAKKCTYPKVVTSFEQAVSAGAVKIPFSGQIGKRKLAVGTYTATLVAVDGAGNSSPGVAIRFTIKRK